MAETCPKCGYTGVDTDECPRCRVSIPKYRAYQEKLGASPTETPTGFWASAPIRWWRGHAWDLFWLSCVAVIFALILLPTPPVSRPLWITLTLAWIAIWIASFVQGIRGTWRRSRRKAALIIALPVLLAFWSLLQHRDPWQPCPHVTGSDWGKSVAVALLEAWKAGGTGEPLWRTGTPPRVEPVRDFVYVKASCTGMRARHVFQVTVPAPDGSVREHFWGIDVLQEGSEWRVAGAPVWYSEEIR